MLFLMDKILLESKQKKIFDPNSHFLLRSSNDYNRIFSWSRLSNAINYFKNRGHDNIIAFLPLCMFPPFSLLHLSRIYTDYREHPNKNSSTIDSTRERQIRDMLINSRYIAFTPSRYNNGYRLTNYDDRYSSIAH